MNESLFCVAEQDRLDDLHPLMLPGNTSQRHVDTP
jgi:hypothetical protein